MRIFFVFLRGLWRVLGGSMFLNGNVRGFSKVLVVFRGWVVFVFLLIVSGFRKSSELKLGFYIDI